MKELDGFTMNRLEQLINFTHENGIAHASIVEWQTLARIALTAKRAESVVYINLIHDSDTKLSAFSDP
ncbi:hypothetical protein NFB56_16030 [Yersinia ruckeri]|uniref:hypothetical protein n=1 Tax=Yersinia ruckeri TaxID=29486 RepID=UPI002238EED0|nr:hypothetical protein [Yersinia ruckeri]MCW6550347.1 hypothetical protein [Yersinia ruckeri]